MSESDTMFRLAGWRVQPALNRVVRGQDEVVLEPKVMAVLVALADRPGVLARRRELLDAVWGEGVAADELLTRAVSELRRVLGDDRRSPRYIETIYTKGYRLVASVERVRDEITPGSQEVEVEPPRRSWSLDHVRWVRPSLLVVIGAMILGAVVATRIRGGAGTVDPHLRVVPLSALPGREVQPAISPDGTRVVFSWAEAGDGSSKDLWLMQRNSAKPFRLTDDPVDDLLPAWSPDGTEIAFARLGHTTCSVWAVSALGGPQRRVADCTPALVGLDWSPDGRFLALADRVSATAASGRGIVLVDLVTGDRRQVTSPSDAHIVDSGPRFSPDGKRLGFRRRETEATYEVYWVGLDGEQPTRLTHDRQDNGGFDWRADGRGIVYSSNRSGMFGLWSLSRPGDEPRWLGFDGAYYPSVAANGAMAVERRRLDIDIVRIDMDSDTEPEPNVGSIPWAQSTHLDLDPAISPDGTRVVFVSQRTAGQELWMAGVAGDGLKRLTNFGRPSPAWRPTVHHPRWSGDGRRVVMAARVGDDFDLYEVDVAGGAPRRLTSGLADDLAPVWFGEDVVFASQRSGSWQLWRRSDTGHCTQLTVEPVRPFVEADGAGGIVFSRGEAGLWRLDPDSGVEHRLVSGSVHGRWTVARGLVHLARADEVVRVDAVTGLPVASMAVAIPSPPSWSVMADLGFSVSADGRMLLVPQVVYAGSDIELVLAGGD